MTNEPSPARPGLFRYGIEAPYVPILMTLGGLISLVLTFVWGPYWLIPCVILLAQAGLYLHTTVRGKLKVWDGLLNAAHLSGTENALDLGCGRGAALLRVAARVPNGKAHGIDLWRSIDQSGNTEEAAMANAVADGVAGVVELHTGDMTKLPFADDTFDLITSALAIHNIPSADGRLVAIDEAFRVTKPGGRLIIVDFRHVKDYATELTKLGAQDVKVKPLGPQYWYGGPWTAASAVIATRP